MSPGSAAHARSIRRPLRRGSGWTRVLARCAAVVLGAVVAAGHAQAQRLPTRDLEKLAKDWFSARPPTLFEEWDPAVRADLEARAAALGEMPEGSLAKVMEILWKQVHKNAPKFRDDEFETPYGKASWLRSGKGGEKEGLVLGLHGGGEGAGSAGEAAGSWRVAKHLCLYPQGIRLVHDTWNTVHGERFLLTLIQMAKAQDEIDPDRVYTMGFSMGGTGSWFLAGRHPDLFAGAIPAHGVIMAEPQAQLATKEEVRALQHGLLPNVRNLPMYWYTGSVDQNCRPGTYLYAWDRMQELMAKDPEGYPQEFQLHEGLAHSFPRGEPEAGIEWVTGHARDPFPTRLVWEYAADPFPQVTEQDPLPRLEKHFFYWLYCAEPKDWMQVRAERDGNTIRLTTQKVRPEAFTVLLNPAMIDVEQDVVLEVNGKQVYQGRPRPDYGTLFWTLDARLDRSMVFDRRITIR